MRLSHLLSGLAFGAALSLSALAASAQESEYPVSYVERPLTLPRFALAPEGEFAVERVGGTVPGSGAVVGVGIQLGAAFGITKDFEVNAVVLPIDFKPAGYGDPIVGATYRFLRGEFEMGARLQVTIDHNEGTGAYLRPSVPMLLHIGKIARLDLDPGLDIRLLTLAGASQNTVGLSVPVSFAIDIIEPLHVGANTGIIFGDFGHVGDSFAIPLGIFAGYAIGEKKPIVDIDPFFRWPIFTTPGNADARVNAGIFETGVSVRGYIYL